MKSSKNFNWKKTKRTLNGFVVRCANGSLILQAAGFAPIVIFPNISTADAARVGILLKQEENVRAAITFGAGHRACVAADGRGIEIGTKKVKNEK